MKKLNIAALFAGLMLFALTASATTILTPGSGKSPGAIAAEEAQKKAAANASAAISQQQALQQNKQNAEKGSDMATMKGILSIGMGGMDVQQGFSTCPEACNFGLIMKGMMEILTGMQGLEGAKALSNAAANSGVGMDQLTCAKLGTCANNGANPTGSSITTASTNGSAFGIDTSLLHEGAAGDIMSKVEASLGVQRDAFAKAIASGKDPMDLLSKMKGANPKMLKDAMAKAKANFSPSAAAALNAKNGMNKVDAQIAARMGASANNSSAGGASASLGGKGSSGSGMDDLFKDLGKDDKPAVDPSRELAGLNSENISPEVKENLDQNGITEQSIFQMVSSRYKKVTPMMEGQDAVAEQTQPGAI